MLLTRLEEVRIIISELENKKTNYLKKLANIRIWSQMANVNVSNSELYLDVSAKLEMVENKIKAYKEL